MKSQNSINKQLAAKTSQVVGTTDQVVYILVIGQPAGICQLATTKKAKICTEEFAALLSSYKLLQFVLRLARSWTHSPRWSGPLALKRDLPIHRVGPQPKMGNFR